MKNIRLYELSELNQLDFGDIFDIGKACFHYRNNSPLFSGKEVLSACKTRWGTLASLNPAIVDFLSQEDVWIDVSSSEGYCG